MAIEDKIMVGFCFLAMMAIFGIIGGCTYVNRAADNESFQLEQQRLELVAAGNPTKLEVVVHKLDDDQFQQLLDAIKERGQ